MNTLEIVSVILGSNVVIEFVKNIFNRKKVRADAAKTSAETDEIEMEGEQRLINFYREQLDNLVERHDILEQKLNRKIMDHEDCESRLSLLEDKYIDLQKQFTVLLTQLNK